MAELSTINFLVSFWQGKLKLSHWDIEIAAAKEVVGDFFKDDDSHAGVWHSTHYDKARLYLNPDDISGWSMEEAEQQIVHELLHLVFRDFQFAIEWPEDFFPGNAAEPFKKVIDHELEGVIDRMASCFVELKNG